MKILLGSPRRSDFTNAILNKQLELYLHSARTKQNPALCFFSLSPKQYIR